jgi:hypothetical protein
MKNEKSGIVIQFFPLMARREGRGDYVDTSAYCNY